MTSSREPRAEAEIRADLAKVNSVVAGDGMLPDFWRCTDRITVDVEQLLDALADSLRQRDEARQERDELQAGLWQEVELHAESRATAGRLRTALHEAEERAEKAERALTILRADCGPCVVVALDAALAAVSSGPTPTEPQRRSLSEAENESNDAWSEDGTEELAE